MIHWLWIVLIVIVLLGLNLFVFVIGKKKGRDDFLKILFEMGFLGKTDAFKTYNRFTKKGGSVFVGDSITQDFNVYEFFPDHLVYNRGIGGDTSKGVLNRLNESVYELKPKKLFLQIGTNDLELIETDVRSIATRIEQIIQEVKTKAPEIKMYLISVYPVNKNMDSNTVGRRSNKDIEALNLLLKEIKNVEYINAYDVLVKEGSLNPEYSLEGLHLNQKGYQVLRKVILPYLEEIVE